MGLKFNMRCIMKELEIRLMGRGGYCYGRFILGIELGGLVRR